MPTARWNLAAAEYNNLLFVIGGDNNLYTRAVEIFDGSSWASAPEMSTSRIGLASAVFNGLLYAIGGLKTYSESDLNSVEVFNGVSWTTTFPMRIVRIYLAAAVL